MKTLIALIAATVGIAAAAPEASAGGHRHGGIGLNFGHGGININVGHGGGCYHRPVYKLYTRETCRRYFCKTHYTHCGRPYTVRYVSITYTDFYSNGSRRSYTRSFRA